MERQSISLITFSVLLGVLIGGVGLLSALYVQGYFTPNDDKQAIAVSGMDILNEYNCRKAETKQIILGGVEDNFDSSGEESTNPSQNLINYLDKFGETGARAKDYDVRTLDMFLSDQFDIPKRSYHGIVAIRVEELSDLKNDGISLGYNPSEDLPFVPGTHGHNQSISNLDEARAWKQYNNLIVASLSELKVTEPSAEFKTVLDVIRSHSDGFGKFIANIADDSIVDFIGFALCLEPAEHKGTVYSNESESKFSGIIDFGEGHTGFGPAEINGEICTYGGCLSCEEERPLSCMRDLNLPIDEKSYPSEYKHTWSGGEIAFTKAIKGSSFETEDDVNKFCAQEFGAGWRATSRHDGHWGGYISGIGVFPPNYDNVWVNVKTAPHANCWKLRPSYEAVSDR